jgi:hypothetical protein
MKRLYRSLCVLGFLSMGLSTPAWASSSSPEVLTVALNPNNDANRAGDSATDRAIFRISQPVLLNAASTMAPVTTDSSAPAPAASGSTWFRQPSVFVNNLFTNTNDQRPLGLESTQYRLQVGFDFVSYADIIVGALYTYGLEEGEIDDFGPGITQDFDKTSHYLTLYAGRSFGEWFLAGATMTFGDADQDNETLGFQGGTDTFSYSPSVYAGVAHAWDQAGFSSVAAYQYEDIYYDNGIAGAPGFNTSTGTFTWKTQGTWFAADWVDVSAFYKLTQIVHSNAQLFLLPGENNDHNWSNIGAKATFYPAKGWEAYAGIDYDLFNHNYGENITGMIGAGYKF